MFGYNSAKANSVAKGFTLVELLVVISIIALLMSILMPALSRARELGKRAVCLNNLKSLAVIWMMYADDNDGRLVNAMTSPLRKIGLNWKWNTHDPGWDSYFHGPSWVGWPVGYEDNVKAQTKAIKIGTLYPYCKDIKLYRCPTGKRGEVRTYSIGDSMNGYDGFGSVGGVTITKLLSISRPSDRMVFIDEGYATCESWSIPPHIDSWWDAVPLRHSKGTNLSFADGHSDYRKWVDERTIELAKKYEADPRWYEENYKPSPAQLDNPDLEYMQMAVWGHTP